MKAKALFLSALLPAFIYCQEKLLIIDTGNNDPYTYRNFMLLAESAGFKPEVKQFYQLSPAALEPYKSIILHLDGSFLVATAKELAAKQTIESPVLKHIFSLIDALSKRTKSTIGIIVPVPGKKSVTILTLVKRILTKLGLNTESNEAFLDKALNHLLHSDASKSYGYDTALLYKKEQKIEAEQLKQFPPLIEGQKLLAAPLPQNTAFIKKAPELTLLYPLGFYFKNQQTENHFFITNESYMHATDINERFTLNPVDSQLRNALLSGLLAMIYELRTLQRKNKITKKQLTLPHSLTDAFSAQQKKQAQQQRKNILAPPYDWIPCEGIACGWMHLDPFENKQEEVAERILKSGQNMLWLQLTPEWFLSDNGTRTAEEKTQFFERITQFTTALHKKAHELKKQAPRIFVGMELSGNFGTQPVNEAATTLYGTSYSKIPAPLDFEQYWKKELIEVFDRFYDQWKQSLGSGLPLAGLFLDFEMYHAPDQTGQYSNLMDFSDLSWQAYTKKTNNTALAKLKTTNDRLTYLLHNNQLENYFTFLESEAKALGKKIKDHINQILPDGIIAAYNINLPHSWFYKGILAGLSSPEKPLILATFNNDYYTHYDWLTKNNIHLFHLPVLLFSKLRNTADFNLINKFSEQHDGLWFNRYSRLEEPRNEEKTFDHGIEASPLDTSTVIKLMQQHIEQVRTNLLKTLPQLSLIK